MRRSVNCARYLVACFCLCASVILADPDVHSDPITLEWKQIFVTVQEGPTLSLMVEPDQTVGDLRRDLNELEGIPFARMITKIGDTELDNTKKLSEYNIGADRTIVTVEIPDGAIRWPAQFYVRTFDGRVLLVATQLDNSVASLKRKIMHLTGIAYGEQRLLVKGKELKDERKLVHYAIGNDTRVELGRPLEDCRQVVPIVVETPSGARIEVEVDLADTVNGLKEKICAKTGIPPSVQHLSDSERTIAGKDRLCDLGIEAHSTVFMSLYSAQITNLDQVARLRELPPVNGPVDTNRAPIFHEAEDLSEPGESGHRRPAVSLYKDARNWVARDGDRPSWSFDQFDPIAHLDPNPDDERFIEIYRRYIETALRPDAEEWYLLEAPIHRARVKISSALRPYRTAANLNSVDHYQQSPGISLGGGSVYVSPRGLVPLGADMNNWAPDALSDTDVVRLFEVSERVRQVRARDEETGEGTLSMANQRRINRAILYTYISALAGLSPSVEYSHAREGEVCGICMDDLTAEPAIKLGCAHAFHTDCILPWAADLIQAERVPSCPLCRQRFMLPYETLGGAELKTPELRNGNRAVIGHAQRELSTIDHP